MTSGFPSRKQKSISISTEILRSAKIDIAELKHDFFELHSILGQRAEQIVPQQINDLSTLCWVIDLSKRLQKLRGCGGFDKHIARYTPKEVRATHFVAVMASYLLDRVEKLVLEPPVGRKSADILVVFGGEEVYVECKGIQTEKFEYREEHENMFSVLSEYVNVPHQIDIRYSKSLSDAELHRLGDTLRERLPLVKGTGKIVDNLELEVQVMPRQVYPDKRLAFRMAMIVEDLNANRRYPGHAFVQNGINLSFAGPLVDYTHTLRQRLRMAKTQSPDDRAYLLAIDATLMLGDLAHNIRALSSAFQPSTNTRFSAAILVAHHLDLKDRHPELRFHLAANPFASFPISNDFQNLFPSLGV